MVTHFIFMSSSYSLGTRIALDYIMKIDKEGVKKDLKQNLDRIIKTCGKDVSISTHMIQVEDITWESVCKADRFFEDVKLISDVAKFIELIKKDRKLQGIDVAKYILAKISCTQLKLQKLVYLCFADYLCDTEKELFTDNIFAFKYGPVVESVYAKYKKYGYNPIEKDIEDIDSNNISEMPSKSRIIFSEYGTEKIQSIEKTLRKYGSLSAAQLVELTHKDNTPWSKTIEDKGKKYPQIKIDIIKRYHKFETI